MTVRRVPIRSLIHVFSLVLLLPLFLGAQDTDALDLRGICAFRAGDDDTWMSKYIDERENWSFLKAPGSWERQGYPTLDGFAWYRFRFRLPPSLLGDSLVLVIDGIDDADETFFNGWLVGRSGRFPPRPRSESGSLRIYPLPRRMQEEFNLIAIRVYDISDSGGLPGNTIKVVRASRLPMELGSIPESRRHSVPLFLSNGDCLARFRTEDNSLSGFYPHVYHELEPGIETPNTLQKLGLSFTLDGMEHRLDTIRPRRTEYYHNTSVVHQIFDRSIETFWFIPHVEGKKIIVILFQSPLDLDIDEVHVSLTLLRPAFAFREFRRRVAGASRHYIVLSYNSCCREFAERDIENFISDDRSELFEAYELETEMMHWGNVRSRVRVPRKLTEEERTVYLQSVTSLLSAQVHDPGSSNGQIVSSLEPENGKYAVPFEHLHAAASLALAGATDEAETAIQFCLRLSPGAYIFWDLYGREFGLGLPYRISPVRYLGSGAEFIPERKDDVALTVAGNATFFHAFQAYMFQRKRESAGHGMLLTDSMLITPVWNILSTRIADILLHRLDSTHLITRDSGPWGRYLEEDHSISTSLWAAYGLRLASRFAAAIRDTIHMVTYRQGASSIIQAVDSLVRMIAVKESADELTELEQLVFDPLLIEGVTLGLFPSSGPTAEIIIGIVEKAYRNGDYPYSFLAKPDGDWFERMERPYLTLLLAQAYARNGQTDRAEEYFRSTVRRALENHGMLPELRDPRTGNVYGGLPSVCWGASAFIHTAHIIHDMRLAQSAAEEKKAIQQ